MCKIFINDNNIRRGMVEHVPFKLKSEFEPQGDQPQAIQYGVNEGKRHQTLLGATGTGKIYYE